MAVAGAAASAATFADEVVSQLASHGYSNINVESTWLGRMRITGSRSDGQREIILNPRTGEILRDTWQGTGDGAARPIIDDIGDRSGKSGSGQDATSGSGQGDSGDSGDPKEDNSGSGSNNSGEEPEREDHSGKDDEKDD